MRKIIDRKLYDTEKATRIGGYKYGNPGDFEQVEEDLYVTKNGRFFLVGEGGPMSEYRTACGSNGWTGGSDIIVLDKKTAEKWAEQHLELDPEEYASFFGELEDA